MSSNSFPRFRLLIFGVVTYFHFCVACYGQPSGPTSNRHDPLSLARTAYPWPAPVDSRSRPHTVDDSKARGVFQWPGVGQDMQRWLAESEAARRKEPNSPQPTTQSAAVNDERERRWAFAWPKSLDPRNLSPKHWLRGRGGNDEDPFIQAHPGNDSPRVAGYDHVQVSPGAMPGGRAGMPRNQTAGNGYTTGATASGPGNRYPRTSNPSGFAPGGSSSAQELRNRPTDVNPYAAAGYQGTQPIAATRPAPVAAASFESTDVIAMVGDHPILAGDLLGQINEALQPYVDQVPESELEKQRVVMMKQFLPQLIDAKLMYLEFERSLPPEALPEAKQKVSEYFMKEELPNLIERAKVDTAQALDAKLRGYGSSLEKQKRMFLERVFASQARAKEIQNDDEVTHEQMLTYYRDHLADYEFASKARWERLMVRFDRFDSKRDAYQAIARMGDQVRFGASLQEVAKRESQGSDAVDGGYHDWTTQGSLVSEQLDRAIFELPLNRLSQIIEDDKGFHIVRVLERQAAGRVSFQEAQAKIKETIKNQRYEEKVQAYLAQLREKTRIWTAFDAESDDASRIARPSPGSGRPF